jgi:signal transduction histidine kinase
MRQVGVPELAFWTCFGVLVSVSAAYGVVFAVFVSHDQALNVPVRGTTAWSIAGACWVFALYPIWLIARLESRWIRRRVQEPIAALIQQCEKIRDSGGFGRLKRGCSGVERDRCDADIERLAVAVNDVLDRFQQIVVSQHQFTADAAHELRTPLTAQSLVGENALARRCTGTELREVVGSMLEESKHMKRLIESLLELTRASVTTADVPTPLELSDLARDCVESLTVLAEEKGQRIELTARPVWADADPTMVRQAILNVIHNAIEHCPAGARIHRHQRRCFASQTIGFRPESRPRTRRQQRKAFERARRGAVATDQVAMPHPGVIVPPCHAPIVSRASPGGSRCRRPGSCRTDT